MPHWDTGYPHDDDIWSNFDNGLFSNSFLGALRGVEFGCYPYTEHGGWYPEGQRAHRAALVVGLKERLVIGEKRGLLRFGEDQEFLFTL